MSAKIGRNEPCPCGSRRKYTECSRDNGSGDLLNQLHDRYELFPNNQQAIHELFVEIQNYAQRVLAKECASKGWLSLRISADDIVQRSLLNIWKGLKAFRHESKFSTWCYRVIQTRAIDTIRGMPQGEVELLPWKVYAEYCGTAHGGSTGAAPSSGKAYDAFAQSLLSSPCKKKDDDCDGHGFAARPLLAKSFLGQEENRLNAEIDFRAILNGLNPVERQIAELCGSGYTALEIAGKFSKDTTRVGHKCSPGERWVQNRIAKIKRVINTGEIRQVVQLRHAEREWQNTRKLAA